jgi:hypothetical protein
MWVAAARYLFSRNSDRENWHADVRPYNMEAMVATALEDIE